MLFRICNADFFVYSFLHYKYALPAFFCVIGGQSVRGRIRFWREIRHRGLHLARRKQLRRQLGEEQAAGTYLLNKMHSHALPSNRTRNRQSLDNFTTTKSSAPFLQGQGLYIASEKNFRGEWQDSLIHGVGIYRWGDGRSYAGEYEKDRKHGFGTFQWPDGRRYEGFWCDGKQDGDGLYTRKDGSQVRGVWAAGKRVS